MASRRAKISGALGAAASVATIVSFLATAGGTASPASSPSPSPAAAATAGPVFAYPQNVQDNYLNGCEASASTVACQCTLDWFQSNIPLARFEQDDTLASQGETPADLASAVAACQ